MVHEVEKLANRRTAARCAAHGIRLVPMVVETLGGWGPAAQFIFKAIARATAQKLGVPDSVATARLYQALGVRLQRANARAILLRTAAGLLLRNPCHALFQTPGLRVSGFWLTFATVTNATPTIL